DALVRGVRQRGTRPDWIARDGKCYRQRPACRVLRDGQYRQPWTGSDPGDGEYVKRQAAIARQRNGRPAEAPFRRGRDTKRGRRLQLVYPTEDTRADDAWPDE